MVKMAPRRNNLLLLFLHVGAALMGGVGEQVARSSCRSSDPVRFVSDGRHSTISRVALVSAVAVVFGVLQWGAWMAEYSGVPLLRSRRMKLTALGSSGHGEEPRSTCHKASVSSLAAVRFIGSKSILVCKGAPLDVGMKAVPSLSLAAVRFIGRSYNALAEYVRRFRAFRDNLDFVDAHNARDAQHGGFRLGMNRFADLTNAEFRAVYLGADAAGRRHNGVGERYRHRADDVLPESVDWREKGAVAPVKNQGQCGSCWAFSTVAAVEGVNKIVTGDLVTLSEQELVDCSNNGQNSGCNGGIMNDAFDFIVWNGGIDTEKDYPYTAKEGECDIAKKARRKVVSIDGFEEVPADDEASLMKAVAHQPVSVAIEAGGGEFQLYESGVFTGRCGTELDHAVLAVGYGTEAVDGGKDYWIVRNSWGPGWGEGGYIRMERNVTASAGKCGIAMFASYPVKNGPNPKPAPPAPEEKCDRYSSCPAGSTCCCTYGVRTVCLAWGCCPAKGATCCRDRATCCPSEFPVCNIRNHTCAKSKGSPYTVDALPRTPAKRQRTHVSELVDSIFSF